MTKTTNDKTSSSTTNPKQEEKVTELSNVQKLKYFITMYNIENDTGSSSKDKSCVSPSVWKSDGKSLSTENLYGNIQVDVTSSTKFPKGEFGIQESGRLNRMLGCLSENDVVITKTGNQIKFKNGKVDFNYHLCGVESINDLTPDIDTTDIDYNASISMTKDMMDDFTKCYSSFPSDVKGDTMVTIHKNKTSGKYYLDVNQSNSHKMTIPVNVETDELTGKVSFSASSWNKVFNSNPKSSGVTISLTTDGICLMTFDYEDEYSSFKSNYNVLPLSMIPEDEVETETSSEELEDGNDPKLTDEELDLKKANEELELVVDEMNDAIHKSETKELFDTELVEG